MHDMMIQSRIVYWNSQGLQMMNYDEPQLLNENYEGTVASIGKIATDTHQQSKLDIKLVTDGIPIEVASPMICLSLSN
jgi:hypothetical protein